MSRPYSDAKAYIEGATTPTQLYGLAVSLGRTYALNLSVPQLKQRLRNNVVHHADNDPLPDAASRYLDSENFVSPAPAPVRRARRTIVSPDPATQAAAKAAANQSAQAVENTREVRKVTDGIENFFRGLAFMPRKNKS